jgi:hypothetical protein
VSRLPVCSGLDAEDSALAADRTTVVIKRCQASQSGRFAAIELTELGHLREQERSRARAHGDFEHSAEPGHRIARGEAFEQLVRCMFTRQLGVDHTGADGSAR